jgi:predicted nuclease of predicted toxin-antitoxin system
VRFLLDECADARVVPHLRDLGHDVATVAETDQSADDTRVLQLALREDRVVITTDLDFGELLVRERRGSAGVIQLRLEGVPPPEVARRIDKAATRHGPELRGHLLVIDRRRDRLRRLPTFPS